MITISSYSRVCGASQLAQQLKKKNPTAVQKLKKMWVGSLGWEDPLEEGIATHSSILAERIPRTQEPGVLQSIRSWTQLKQHSMHTCTH